MYSTLLTPPGDYSPGYFHDARSSGLVGLVRPGRDSVGVYARAMATGESAPIKRGKSTRWLCPPLGIFRFLWVDSTLSARPAVNRRAIRTKSAKVGCQFPAPQSPSHRHDAFSGSGYNVLQRTGFSHRRLAHRIHPASGIQNRVWSHG
jgi:hypothetical protein